MIQYGKKVKQCIVSETIIVCDIKVGRCSQPDEFMKLYEYQLSRSFFDLGPKSQIQHFQTSFSLETRDRLESNFICNLCGIGK